MFPLVIAYHLIWTVYGSWLPNDPRGSTSRQIASEHISELGELHFGRKKIQPASRDIQDFYEEAGNVLKHTPLEIRGAAVDVVADALAEVIAHQHYTCYACAIMPDHIHILIRKHKHRAEEMIEHLQTESRKRLIQTRHVPSDHPVWTAGGGWAPFLGHPDDIERTISYIENNPLKIGLPGPQRWPFVVPYDRWPLHEGHSPNSPYVQRLRALGRYP